MASWGGDLLDRGILTVSLAPRDNHEAQVQFALERGIPAVLGIISTQRLPFPSNSNLLNIGSTISIRSNMVITGR